MNSSPTNSLPNWSHLWGEIFKVPDVKPEIKSTNISKYQVKSKHFKSSESSLPTGTATLSTTWTSGNTSYLVEGLCFRGMACAHILMISLHANLNDSNQDSWQWCMFMLAVVHVRHLQVRVKASTWHKYNPFTSIPSGFWAGEVFIYPASLKWLPSTVS